MKSKSKQQTAETIAPNPTYAPYVNDAANQQQGAYQAAQSNINQNILPRLNQGMNYYGDELAGKYLNGNPYLDSVLSKTNQDISQGVNSQFEGAGRYGSGNHAGVLADRIAANENQLRYGDYANERGYMNQAASGLGQLATVSSALPQLPSAQYAEAIQALLGKYANSNGTSTTTQTQGAGSLLGSILGAGLSGWASGGFKG